MSGIVTLWLNVHEGTDQASMGTLWTKQVAFSFLPREGDRVHLTWDAESQEWDFPVDVKRVYFNGDGSAHVEMRPVQVDPTPTQRMEFVRNERWARHTWNTNVEGGHPAERLRASNWEIDYFAQIEDQQR